MSNATYSGSMPSLGQGSASTSDLVNKLDGIMRNLASSGQTLTSILSALQSLLPVAVGTFTLTTGSATTTVSQPLVKANSYIPTPTATNSTAALLMGSGKYLYISSINPGVSFTVATGNAQTAAGSETFQYAIFAPVG